MTQVLTVGELIERLHQFDEDLPIVMDGEQRKWGFNPHPNLTPVLYAELPEHEQHVLLTANVYPDGRMP